MARDEQGTELRMNPADMYREETFTDQRIGSIRRLTPILSDGSPDHARATLYMGQAQLMTPMGAVPLAFDIEAGSLEEAVEKFAEGAREAVERTARELEDLRREAASSIVVPKPGSGGLGGPPGMPGGGKIQLP